MAPFKVIIVGGGLSGSLLANGLVNNGVEVTIYERDSADSKREGYQIRLGEAAETGFKACLSDDVRAAIHAKFGRSSRTVNSAPMVCNSRFETVIDLTKLPSYSKSFAINRVVLRDILLEPIKRAGRVRYQKRLDRYDIILDERGNERVQVQFSDGSTDVCDILVGADGSGSAINRQVGLRNIVEVNTHMVVLNKGSLTQDIINKLPARLRAGPVLTFKGDIHFFFALYLPAAGGQSSKADEQSEYDLGQGSFYWGLTIGRERFPPEGTSKIPDLLEFCLEQIKDWAPEYRAMLTVGEQASERGSLILVPLRASSKPSKQWRQDARKRQVADNTQGHPRVWLIGDAVHAMQPNRGMGGNQAMQDCADILPELLVLSKTAESNILISSQDVESAVKRYEGKMIDRAFTWVKKSGGTSVPGIDLDGVLGTLVKFCGSLLWLVTSCASLLFGFSKIKQS
ncbi:hypothetical protein NW755_007747 [Fusarium falciforme]|uniref:FAD-binding domain-containing protein n=1 Tax=Fusarium falciforme TaxID=195108 RepID=A0A9W8R6U5_9HYPO|nr:hypothetical protein NW755_007747 [Fusarium falciforme]